MLAARHRPLAGADSGMAAQVRAALAIVPPLCGAMTY